MAEKVVYKGKIFDVARGVMKLPNGKVFTYEYVRFPRVVTMIPILGDKIVMIREYRTSVKKWLIGLPAGKVPSKENLVHAARRETLEETGFKAKEVKLLFKSFASPGYSNEIRYFYLVRCGAKDRQHLDKDEIISVMPMTLKKALAMIKSGKIIDAKTIMALLYYSKFVNPKK